ncbi:hypothetical protein PCASD_17201 [Puccinia coronata f. sp. avenae]|uniref:Uncharacterized protein n=1 Tax=Puccinia coronata f. sp. avenae TaxID=200324 RepID=A0A2N5T784_9BASI|nr:hypothetical protein PCASD_17201 [Puccinia coronata f. sp. avenae]
MILRFKTKRVSLHPPSITAPTNALTQLVTGAQPEVILPLATPSFLQPLRDCVAPESSDLMLMILDKIDQLELEIAYPIGHGIARSEIHSRTTSTALESNCRVYKADAESPLSPQLAVRPRSVDRPLAAQLVASRGHRDVNRHCRLIFSGQEDYHLTNIYDGSCGQLVSPGRDGQTRLRAPPAPSASAIPPNKETSALTSHYGCGETSFRIPGSYASPQHSCVSSNRIAAPETVSIQQAYDANTSPRTYDAWFWKLDWYLTTSSAETISSPAVPWPGEPRWPSKRKAQPHDPQPDSLEPASACEVPSAARAQLSTYEVEVADAARHQQSAVQQRAQLNAATATSRNQLQRASKLASAV